MPRNLCAAALALLLVLAPVAESRPQKPIQTAETSLRAALSPPSRWGDDFRPDWDASVACDEFNEFLHKHGPDIRAYAGLARSQMFTGQYSSAIKSFQSAIRLARPDRQLLNALGVATEYALVSTQVARRLALGHKTLRVLRCPGEKGKWLVLSAVTRPGGVSPYEYRDVRLTLYIGNSKQLQEQWQSSALGSQTPGGGVFNSVSLVLADMTGDGTPEIVVPKTFAGGSRTPAHIDILRWRNGRMARLLGASSEYGVSVRDLNGDGKYEMISKHSIGWELSHVAQPVWMDIFAYRNGTYQLANNSFPGQYDGLAKQIARALKAYPDDWDLLKHRGAIYQIQGNPRHAQTTLQLAKQELEKHRTGEKDPETLEWMGRELDEIERWLGQLN